jgi:adenosine kinase
MATPNIHAGYVFGIENPLLDISATLPNADLFTKYDLKPANACLAEPKHLPLYDEIVKNFPVEYSAGGSVQNAMRACQWMLQTPKICTFVGCVGNDANASILQKNAEEHGVGIHYMHDPAAPTGTCAVLVYQKDRSLVANLGAANNYKITHLQSEPIWHLVKHAHYFYSSGYFLTVSPDSAVLLGKHACEHNKVFAWNIAAPFVCQFFWKAVQDLLPYVDVLFGNETEAAAFATASGWATTDLKEIAKKVAELPKANPKRPRLVIFTHGLEPAIAYQDGVYTAVPAKKIDPSKIVDTNGAGDSFVGGFLAQCTVQNIYFAHL